MDEDDNSPQAEQLPIPADGLLTALLQSEAESQNTKSGLDEYTGLLVQAPEQYPTLPPSVYRALTQELKLFPSLPRAPTLGEYSFLLKKSGSEVKELFEDHWATSTLTYSAAAELYVQLVKAKDDEKLAEDSPIFDVARKLLLCSTNSLGRSLEVYKYLATKATLKTAPRPGTQRSSVLSTEEAKNLNCQIDITRKLQQNSKPKVPPYRPPSQRTYYFGQYPGVYRGSGFRGSRGNRSRGRRGRGRDHRGRSR